MLMSGSVPKNSTEGKTYERDYREGFEICKLRNSIAKSWARRWLLVGRSRPIGPMGTVWTTECRVGRFLAVLGIYAYPQLVFAGGDDPTARGHRHRRGNSLRSFSSHRLAHTRLRASNWTSSGD